MAPARNALHRPARAPPPRPPAAARRRHGRAVDLPGGVRDGRGRGRRRRLAAARRPPLRARRGRGRPRGRRTQRRFATSPRSRPATPPTCAAKLAELLALARADRDELRAAARSAVVERWSWAGVAARLLACLALRVPYAQPGTLSPMGEEQTRLLAGAARAAPARRSRRAPTSPSRSRRSSRSSTRDARAHRTASRRSRPRRTQTDLAAAPRRRADRLRGRGAHRPLRGLRRGRGGDGRARAVSSTALARELGLALGATGTHPWSRWQDQRIIDTPHYRRNDELLRYVVWRNNTFGLHVHVGIAGADRAIAVHDALRNFLPELLALSASSPFVEKVNSGLHSARTQIFTRMFPRCGIPDAYDGWQGFEDYVVVPLPHGLDHRAHPALVERPAASRLPDGRDPDLRRPARPRRGAVARGARLRARRPLRARPRRGRAAAEPAAPAARGEHVARDPLRALGRADRLRARRAGPGAGAARAADRVGRAGRRGDRGGAVPRGARANAAERQIARFEEGATLEEIYAEQVRAGAKARRSRQERRPGLDGAESGTSRSVVDDGPTPEELSADASQIGSLEVRELVLSAVSTFATVG